MNRSTEPREREGFSLIEVLISMSMLTVAMMGLASAATLGLSQMGKARQDLQYSADVQQIADSLVAKGWTNVTAGSATIRGRSVSWTVTTLNAKSQKLNIVAQRRGLANAAVIYSDTVTVYLADPKVQ
jgi:prepilin-type N-terminal cleavage/methylation domain-containing protein